MLALLAACIGLMVLDQVTGPYVRVSVVFVIPVALAAYRWNWMIGTVVGTLLGSSRVWLVLRSQAPWLVLPELVNLGLSLLLFTAVAVTAQRLRTRLGRMAPTRLLTICGGCGRVREGEGAWRRFERLVSTITTAQFAHTVCPDCAARYESTSASHPGGVH
jgi:hypothetical protein